MKLSLCFSQGSPYEIDPSHHEGDAQELSHIEPHTRLESLLVVLHELDEETGSEDADHENAKNQSLLLPGLLTEIEPHTQGKRQQITDCLVELRRMTGGREDWLRSLSPSVHILDETESPGLIRRVAIDLMVHQVAQTNHGRH